MDAPTPAAPGTAAPLQFDTAMPAQAAAPVACTRCHAPIGDVYHMLNGQVACSRCRAAAEGADAGGALGRLARAALLGTGAAVAGCAINYAWMAATNSEFALIAVVVGFIVGAAVRTGARGRGGWPYQSMAVALTYAAIAISYVPIALQADGSGSDLTGAALYLAVGIGALMWPVLAIVKSPLSAFIIAIGLYQAWKQTRGVKLEITGPYFVGQPRPMSFAAPAGG